MKMLRDAASLGTCSVVLVVLLTLLGSSEHLAVAAGAEPPWDCVVLTVTRVTDRSGTRAKPPVVEIAIEEILTTGSYPPVVQAVWEPEPLMCTTDYCARPDAPVEAPRQGTRWVAWIQNARGGAKLTVNLRGFFARPFSDEARKIMAQQCLSQGRANERVAAELKK